LIPVGIVVIALVAVLYKGLSSALVYFYTAQQAVAMKATLGSSTFRMEGVVVPGTISPTANGVDFSVQFDRTVVKVIEVGSPPQLFQPKIPVVVVGHFVGQVFYSDQIMVKHSANYVAAHPGRIANAGGGS
jgi:cytochrome c-type biogenesis protein CcmE